MVLPIHRYNELITSREQTRAGFIEAALAKNDKARPFIESAKSLKVLASKAATPDALFEIKEIRSGLLTASGLSDKANKYFTEEDKDEAIKEIIDKFLKPAGASFVDELVYRYLLIKGDSLGGSMRNYIGLIAQMKLTRKLLSLLTLYNIPYQIFTKVDKADSWVAMPYEDAFNIAEDIKGIFWDNHILLFNKTIPTVQKNVDICLWRGTLDNFDVSQLIAKDNDVIMFGELKGGIDPAGADEHWKTGNTALERIRSCFSQYNIKTAFVAAAIENAMAKEIFNQWETGVLSYAANLSVDEQLTNFCNWIIKL